MTSLLRSSCFALSPLSHFSNTMEILAIYAIASGGILASLFVTQALSIRNHLPELFSAPCFQYLALFPLAHRHRFWGPWTGASVFLHVSYAAINIFLVFFRIESFTDAGSRAGELALINQIFPLSTINLSHLADSLGIRWSTCRRIHRATGWMSVALLSFHIIVVVQTQKFVFPLRELHNLFTLIVSLILAIILIQLTYDRLGSHWGPLRRFPFRGFVNGLMSFFSEDISSSPCSLSTAPGSTFKAVAASRIFIYSSDWACLDLTFSSSWGYCYIETGYLRVADFQGLRCRSAQRNPKRILS